MSPTAQELAAAASDSYKNRLQSDVDGKGMLVHFGGRKYRVFAYRADPATGFHATAYIGAAEPFNIIIAYRGTDPDIKHHTRTTIQDAATDFTMVKDQVNPQEAAARAFTGEVLDKAQALGISRDHVTVAGHSLGGALAQIEAFRFGLRGMTFNAYGAADLGYGVPAGGDSMTNYVMAGDVVSAASQHYGRTITLASEEDITSLRAGRYLDAASGAPPPNPLLAMRLGDHGNANFLPTPDHADPLSAGDLAQAEARYASHREAFDRFRGDVATDRAALAAALAPGMKATWANLLPRVQDQLAEYHAHLVDAPIHATVEHNRAVAGIEEGLAQYHDAMLAGGPQAQQAAAQVADRLHAAGQTMQRQADELARDATAFMPVAPLAVGGAAMGAEIVGHVAHTTADGYAGASQLAGTAARAGSEFVAGQFETARHAVETGAQLTARAATQVVHTQESALARATDHVLDVYGDLSHTVDTTRQIVTRGIEAAEHAAGRLHDVLRHPERALNPEAHNDTPAQHNANVLRHLGDPAHPQHALHATLADTMPSCTSAARLAQATAACHAHGITADNLQRIHIDGKAMSFASSSRPWEMAQADLTQPPPTMQQSLQQMQAVDQQRACQAAPFQPQPAQTNPHEMMQGASVH
ncbi:MAG: hypothetical protein WBA33_12350 [Rhodanobacter lindaniclasticus]